MESLKFTKGKLLLICLAVFVITVITVTVFKVSIGNLFFLAFLLACPLMHFFMMKGHGSHDNSGKKDGEQPSKTCH